MLIKIFTLRPDSETLDFDDGIVQAFCSTVQILSIQTQFYFFQDLPTWTFVITYRPKKKVKNYVVQKGVTSQKTSTKSKKAEMFPWQKKIYDELCRWRNQRARELGYPPANVLNNRQIREIVELQPKNKKELKEIFGVGEKRTQQFGSDILSILSRVEPDVLEKPQSGTVGTDNKNDHVPTHGTHVITEGDISTNNG